jgi:hypothetical protein
MSAAIDVFDGAVSEGDPGAPEQDAEGGDFGFEFLAGESAEFGFKQEIADLVGAGGGESLGDLMLQAFVAGLPELFGGEIRLGIERAIAIGLADSGG